MPGALMWLWDDTDKVFRKALCDSSGKLIISDADPFEIVQDTAIDLKHTPHGRVTGDGVYAPFSLNADNKLQIEVDHLAHHERHENGGADELSIADLDGESVNLAAHKLVADAHHPEEIPDGRGYYNTTSLLKIPGVAHGIATTPFAIPANNIFYYPIYVRTPITVDQVNIEITTAAGAGEKCRIAIYAADKNWQPGALQVASAEIAIDAIAVVATALASTTLQEGRYLIALVLEGGASFRVARYATNLVGYRATLGADTHPKYLAVSFLYAALPDPGTAWDTILFGNDGLYQAVYLQVATP